MKRLFLITTLYVLIAPVATSQSSLSPNDSTDYWLDKKLAEDWALSNNKPVSYFDGEVYYEIQFLGFNDHPTYYRTYNSKAASTTLIKDLYASGSLGINITGLNSKVGVWDGGGVLATHVELVGKTQQRDNPSNISNHATHVTGTIIGRGVNLEAKGMAFNGLADNYDFNGDTPEMREAAENGLIVSNHSYGAVLGWEYNSSNNSWEWFGDADVSTDEDYRFGLYTNNSKNWDQISYDNPYYLIVKSAGNDRSDVGNGTQPADGPYDLIDPAAAAKNILTVGAVNAIPSGYTGPGSVQMSSFSSWGPTDDGRIKPDIVGVGVNVLSSGSNANDSYVSLSGTSMSSPNVAGGLLLLQELNYTLSEKYLLSATLKALVINNAEECGPADGPDYQFGWGLFNAKKSAINLLNQDRNNFGIVEDTLFEDETYFFRVYLEGETLTNLTLAWTDIPGAPISEAILDPTDLALMHDLDIRVYDTLGNEYFPWLLNPQTKQPSKGDNFRDNIEKIQFTSSYTGPYDVVISSKGLTASQNFSVVYAPNDASSLGTTYLVSEEDGNLVDKAVYKDFYTGQEPDSLPSFNDVIIIQNKSGLTKKYYLSESLYTGNLAITGYDSLVIDLMGKNIVVNGNMIISNPSTLVTNGTITFNAHNALFQSDTSYFDGLKIAISDNSTVRFNSNVLHTDAILIGDLSKAIFRNTSLELDSLFTEPSGVVDGSNLSINVNKAIVIDELIGESLYVTIGNQEHALISVGKSFINELSGTISDVRLLELSGQPIFSSLSTNAQKLSISGNVSFDSLKLDQVDSIILAESSRTELGKYVQFVDVNSLTGLGLGATIISESISKICIDDLNVVNVFAEGSTNFVLDGISTVDSSEGWILASCENVVDARFATEYSCTNGIVKFYDLSDGNPVSWQWNFGDESLSNTSNLQNPEYVYTEQGVYLVELLVEDDNGIQSTYSKEITIQNGVLGNPTLYLNSSGQLTTTAFGNNYSWFFNGTEVTSETGAIFNGDLEIGTYYLEIYNATCLKRSPDFIYEPLGITLNDKISIVPNPNSGVFSLKGINNDNLEVLMFNAAGKRIPFTINGAEVNISDQKSGIYFVKIVGDNLVRSFKVIKR